ncbi:MAG TPA: glycosyltransferase family 2 protein [bacterium]|jgi:glycosyltransferase involved in cell wall biosynthesis
MAPRLSVIMPVYNERAFVADALARVRAAEPADKEIIVLDDGSTDGTREYLTAQTAAGIAGMKVYLLDGNKGKGAVLRYGFREAGGEAAIIQDADLEYAPSDYLALLAPIERGTADVVFGNRFAHGRGAMRWPHYLGNRITTAAVNLVSGRRVTDAWVGYKVFRRAVYTTLDLREDGFSVELEITMKLARLRRRIAEVPIAYTPRTRRDGKKIGWHDAARGLWTVLKYSRDGAASTPAPPARVPSALVMTGLLWLLIVNAAYLALFLAERVPAVARHLLLP